MNKTELIDAIAKEAGLSKKDAAAALPGFGTFETRQRSARNGRNPRTGEVIKIKATKAPAFKPGKGMKDAVAKKKK